MKNTIETSWSEILQEEFNKDYFIKLTEFVSKEYTEHQIFPPQDLIFNAFKHCPFDKVKVVILGQDPYHDDNQANGLSFSVNEGMKIPPSLRNIFKELNQDLGVDIPTSGNLESWAKQGVLLLNATLTVRAHEAASHQRKGWEQFTDAVIQAISDKNENIVFFLWGNYAQKKGLVIDEEKHFVMKSVHPSPLSASRGFFGNKQFSQCNSFLESKGKSSITWGENKDLWSMMEANS